MTTRKRMEEEEERDFKKLGKLPRSQIITLDAKEQESNSSRNLPTKSKSLHKHSSCTNFFNKVPLRCHTRRAAP